MDLAGFDEALFGYSCRLFAIKNELMWELSANNIVKSTEFKRQAVVGRIETGVVSDGKEGKSI